MEQQTLGEFHYKANVYKILSELYKKPSKDQLDLFPALVEALQELYPDLKKYGTKLEEILTNTDLDKDQNILVDYSKLFVGPFEMLSSPYGSVYLDEGRRINGESTKFVEGFYERAGIEKTDSFHEPADHISVEFECMYYLYFMYIDTNELKYLNLLQEFTSNHIGKWIFKFTEQIEKHAKQEYYKILGRLTREIFQFEKNNLSVNSVH